MNKTKTLEIKTANVIFEVENPDNPLQPNTDLPTEFPTDDLPAHLQPSSFNENGEFDIAKLHSQTLGRSGTMHSRKQLLDSATGIAAPAREEQADQAAGDKQKDGKKKKKVVEPPKESYKYPGICVSVLRLILSFVNTICFIAGLVFIG